MHLLIAQNRNQSAIMKKYLLLLALFGIVAAGCHDDKTNDNPTTGDTPTVDVPTGNEKGDVELSILLQQTRTSLGEKDGIHYPVYWNEQDKIVVNGILSETIIIDEYDPSCATFSAKEVPGHPYRITYPYSELTTKETPVVEFLAEQKHTEGTFAPNSAPMCGYIEEGNQATLSHLATILRLPVKTANEGVILEKIVITSLANSKIAGEFSVNCKEATIAPIGNTTNTVTYLLPDNYTLSTTKESIFHIALPAVEVGRCTVDFIDASGDKMTARWNPDGALSKGVVREFRTITYKPKANTSLQHLEAVEDEFEIFYKKVYGNVRYSDGSPIADVAMSDGFRVVKTDANGYYEFDNMSPESWHIYCSLPADVEIPVNEYGQPCFFKKYPSSSARYDFTFNRLPNGKEDEFIIFGLADTQPSSTTHIDRFNIQAAPEIKSYSKSLNLPCYGVVMGDMVGSKPDLMPAMRDALAKNKTGMPIFACYGNHDHILCNTSRPAFPDERNSNFYIKLQRDFEECFGPVNYSFNRGDVHIISMRDVKNTSDNSVSAYKTGFTTEQFEWLKQDLKLVPKDKMVILCVHIPIFNSGKPGDGSYLQEVLALLDQYDEPHIFSGHTHYMHPYDHVWYKTGYKIYEHCISSTRQDMMESNIHRDGTPCGYNIFKVKGNKLVDWYYKGYPYGMNTRDYQIRLHRGASIIGAEPTDSDKYGTMGYYQLPYDNGTLLANIFTSDPSWVVEVYEDGVLTGTMTNFFKATGSEYDKLIGDGTLESPRRVAEGVETSRDFWAIGILFGYLGSSVGNNYNTSYTIWKYKLKNPNASHIEVRTKDRFGYEYRCDRIEDNSDLGFAMYDPQYNPRIE